jgi:hypothetical protein
MGDQAVLGAALGGGDAPGIGRRLDQHLPRDGAALAHIEMALADAAAAAGGEAAPGPVATQVLARRRILGGDLGPVALQLLGHQLRQAGQGALAHLRARNANDHGVIGLDQDPGVDLRRFGIGRALRAVFGYRHAPEQRQVEPERKAGAGAADQKFTSRDLQCAIAHDGCPPRLISAAR